MLPAPKDAFSSEWVELYNPGSQPIDLAGWTLDDAVAGSGLSLEGLIGPGELMLIELTRAILNNSGDTVRLLAPDGSMVDSLQFAKASPDRSYSRELRTGELIKDTEPSPLVLYIDSSAGSGEAAASGQAHPAASAQAAAASSSPLALDLPPGSTPEVMPPAAQASPARSAEHPTPGRPGAMPTYSATTAGISYELASPSLEAIEEPPPTLSPAPAPEEPPAPPRWPLAAGLGLIVIACGLLVVDRKPF